MKELFVSENIQDAINSIPDDGEKHILHIGKGIYKEKLFIRKNNLEIIGEGPSETVITFDCGARDPRPDGRSEYGTFNTATVLFAGSDITVKDLTIENAAGPGNVAGQSLAAYVAADRCAFYNCHFLGYQDTIFVGECIDCSMKKLMLPDFFVDSKVNVDHKVIRNYFKNCKVEGDVDFIFGPNCAYFDECEIFSRKRESESSSFITAASTPLEQEFGLVFNKCRLTSDDRDKSVFLGRPWRDYAKTAFIECEMGPHIEPSGWHNWGRVKAEVCCSYVEYGNTGAGADTGKRASFSKVLTNPELLNYYSKENVFSYPEHWIIIDL